MVWALCDHLAHFPRELTTFLGSCTNILGEPTSLAIDDAFAKSATPLAGQARCAPDSRRPTLQEVFAVGIVGEGQFDGSVVENLLRDKSDKLFRILACRASMQGRDVDNKWE